MEIIGEDKVKYKREWLPLTRTAYIEVNWNKWAWKHDMIKIVIGEEKVIMKREEVEAYFLYLSKDPSRFLHSRSKTVGKQYVPVADSMYRDYMERKGAEEKAKQRTANLLRNKTKTYT